ncbi:hypothetical protein [Actinomadura sp. WMMB 499]|uniref:hypothetical protein n=1 Tax=Actinomadura sp. WMMB 499 TaxID=1219491 RepID=UPI001246EE23|nr:hypothetical protein [Actinomadura sp. WMMB 499]QFG22374.1 hypothetical protein F7P10_15805 [Actinomadura sp. WMMB 499]
MSFEMRKAFYPLGLLTTGLFLAGTIVTPAYADHGGDVIGPDNNSQAVKGQNLTARGKLALQRGRAQLDRSKINTSSGGGDIYVRDGRYGNNGSYGRMWCSKQDGNGDCDIFQITFNNSELPARDYAYRAVGCHEFGHTGTLRHRSRSEDTDGNSCMRTYISDTWAGRLDSHDINAINGNA